MEKAIDFIANCIGLEPSVCDKLDEIDEKFHFIFSELELSDRDVQYAIESNPRQIGNELIRMYYEREIEYLLDRYRPDGITPDMFDYEANGSSSNIYFDGEAYESEDELEDAIRQYIADNEKER